MKLARCMKQGGAPFWAVVNIEAKLLKPISGDFHDWAPKITNGAKEDSLELNGASVAFSDVTFLAPIEKTNKIIVAGGNYGKHLEEFGVPRPKQPIAFMKAYGALIGAYDEIRYPPITEKLDYEVELVVVIGDAVDPDNLMNCVLGYTAGNDVSSRDIQRRSAKGVGMDLFGSKSQDKTTGVGPWIVTKDEFADGTPELELKLSVNGGERQNGNTSEMLWKIDELIQFVNERSSFECGDIMFTGTPAGVADASGEYLQPGDIVEATVGKIGTLRNVVSQKNTA
ncbi:MAG: hydrolase [Robiginitomaculum sp.]|nr:MAG: hydrolase [Robiginitomaculum sp.]